MNKNEPRNPGKEVAALPVAPKQTRDGGRDTESKGQKQGNIPAVLPPHNLVLAQIADVGDAGLTTWFEEHPTDVGKPEALVSVVRVQVGVSVTVVGTVAPGPPFNRTLDGTSTSHSQYVLQRLRGIVRPVGP